MENPINSVYSRVIGSQLGEKRKPVKIGSYSYHLHFDDMATAYDLIPDFANPSEPTIVTANQRKHPASYLEYNPTANNNQKTWKNFRYYEYVEVAEGYYGFHYYLFGSGKVCWTLPDLID